MDITGKIIWAGELKSGISAQSGKPWATQDFVIRNESNGPYGTITTNIKFNVFGEDKLAQWAPRIGDEVTVSYGINARENQGQWYNEVRAYKYERVGQTQPLQSQYPAQGYQQGGQYAQNPYPQQGNPYPQQGGYPGAPNR